MLVRLQSRLESLPSVAPIKLQCKGSDFSIIGAMFHEETRKKVSFRPKKTLKRKYRTIKGAPLHRKGAPPKHTERTEMHCLCCAIVCSQIYRLSAHCKGIDAVSAHSALSKITPPTCKHIALYLRSGNSYLRTESVESATL